MVSTMKLTSRLQQSLTAALLMCCISSAFAETKTITIQPNDTLSKIVSAHYPEIGDRQAVMVQILQQNPDAFVNNSIHRLIVGKPLTLPANTSPPLAPDNAVTSTQPDETNLQQNTTGISSEEAKQIAELEKAKDELLQQAKQLTDENQNLKVQIQGYEKERKTLDKKLKTLEQEVETLEKKLEQQSQTQPNNLSDNNTDELQAALAQAKAELKQSQESNQQLTESLADTEKRLKEQNLELDNLKDQITGLNSTTEQLESDLEATRAANMELLKSQPAQSSNTLLWALAGLSGLLLLAFLWAFNRKQAKPEEAVTAPVTTSTAITKDTTLDDPSLFETKAIKQPVLPEEPANPDANIKLNIARAYLDMRDTDSAFDMLHEVLREGSNQQKQEAREILSFIS